MTVFFFLKKKRDVDGESMNQRWKLVSSSAIITYVFRRVDKQVIWGGNGTKLPGENEVVESLQIFLTFKNHGSSVTFPD